MKKLRILSLFSGIGAFERALQNLGIEYELVNYCELDKYASKAYAVLHCDGDESKNLHDVTKVTKEQCEAMGEIDLLTYGFPCTDISSAGLQTGLTDKEGKLTRSGLVWVAHDIIKWCKPKIALCENVKALTSKKFAKDFQAILENLNNMGYVNHYDILNSKMYGVPQNRERIFIVSVRKDVENGKFAFPQPFPLKLRLKDVLQDNVDEKYYLKKQNLEWLEKHNERHKEKGTGFIWTPTDKEGIAHTLRANASFCPTDNSVEVEPYNATSDGVSRTLKSSYYKVSGANFNSDGSFGATGVCEKQVVEPLNPMPDGTCRTIKANYQQTSQANLIRKGSYAATGAYVVDDISLFPEIENTIEQDTARIICSAMLDRPGWHQYAKEVISPQGISKTVMAQSNNSVIKIALADEPKLEKVGNIYPSGGQNGNVYDISGISPTIASGETNTKGNGGIGSNNAPKIVEPKTIRLGNVYNNEKFTGGNFGGNVWDIDGIAPACKCTAAASQQFIVENNEELKPQCIGNIYGNQFGTGFGGNVYDKNNISPTLTTAQGGGRQPMVTEKKTNMRIRKLTPAECFKLMGFEYDDAEKLSKNGISNSQLYKQAGNSIVVNVLMEIFRSLYNV